MAKYKVTVNMPSSIKATQRVRAGIIVDRVHGYEGELTEEQLKAINADKYLVVKQANAEGQPAQKAATPKGKLASK